MSDKTCTVYAYNDNGDCIGMCGEKATCIYSRPNENSGPREPTVLTFPRCRTHDTPSVKKEAEETGYEREAIE